MRLALKTPFNLSWWKIYRTIQAIAVGAWFLVYYIQRDKWIAVVWSIVLLGLSLLLEYKTRHEAVTVKRVIFTFFLLGGLIWLYALPILPKIHLYFALIWGFLVVLPAMLVMYWDDLTVWWYSRPHHKK